VTKDAYEKVKVKNGVDLEEESKRLWQVLQTKKETLNAAAPESAIKTAVAENLAE
jgi:hypothetical protein